MVRRGSPVRVRKRALQRPRKAGPFLSPGLARSPVCGGYGALYGAFRSKTPPCACPALPVGRQLGVGDVPPAFVLADLAGGRLLSDVDPVVVEVVVASGDAEDNAGRRLRPGPVATVISQTHLEWRFVPLEK